MNSCLHSIYAHIGLEGLVATLIANTAIVLLLLLGEKTSSFSPTTTETDFTSKEPNNRPFQALRVQSTVLQPSIHRKCGNKLNRDTAAIGKPWSPSEMIF